MLIHPGPLWRPSFGAPRVHRLPGCKGNLLMCFFPSTLSHKPHGDPPIETHPSMVVYSNPYPLPKHKNVIRDELKAMLNMGVIEESHSDWSNPMVLGPKAGTSVFLVWLRKKTSIFRSIWVAPTCHPSIWLVWSPNHISTYYGQISPTVQVI